MNYLLRCAYITSFFLSFYFLRSQSYDWQWARSVAGSGSESGTSVASDQSGNVIVAGYFAGANMVVGSDTIINYGGLDGFIIKYDPIGNVLWAKGFGGTGHDRATGVTADAIGNIYMIGSFGSNTISAGSASLTNSGNLDLFISKYDAGGNILWLKSFGNSGIDVGTSICSTPGGDIAFTGFFSSGVLHLDNETLTGSGGEDVFIAQVNSVGIIQWATSLSGSMNDRGAGLAADASGNIYVTGDFFSPELVGQLDTVFNNGSNDIFTCKLDAFGQILWLKHIGGDWNDSGSALSVSTSGDIVMIATFNSTIVSVGTATAGSKGGFDMLIVSYSPGGALLWAKSVGDIFDEKGYGISYDLSGNIFFTGHTHSPSLIIGNDTIFCKGIGDIFVAGYNGAGNHFMTKNVGGTADDGTSALTCDNAGNIIAAGYFMSPVISSPQFTLNNIGSSDLFVGKIMPFGIVTNITSPMIDDQVIIYPNPSRDKLFISSVNEPIELSILNMQGQALINFNTNIPDNLNLEKLSSGLYIVTVLTTKGKFLKKLVIE